MIPRTKLAPLCCLALILLGGCFSWRTYDAPAPLSSSAKLPYRLRATLTDSSHVDLTAPFVRADTLIGRSGPRRDTTAVPMGSIRRLERERFNLWQTLGVTVAAPAAALLAVFAIVCGDGDCGPTY